MSMSPSAWQGRFMKPGRPPKQPGKGSRTRLWIIIGVAAFVVLMGTQIAGGLSSSRAETPPAATAPVATESSSFLSSGYDSLDSGTTQHSSFSFWGLWGSILLPLLVVIALVYGVLRGLKYVNTRVAGTTAQSRNLESLDVLPLGQQGSVHLIRIGQRVMAVGAGAQQITLLTELEAAQAEELLAARRAQQEQSGSGIQKAIDPFKDLLLKRMHAPAAAAEPALSADEAPAEPQPQPQPQPQPPSAERLAELLAKLESAQPQATASPAPQPATPLDVPFGFRSGATDRFDIVPVRAPQQPARQQGATAL